MIAYQQARELVMARVGSLPRIVATETVALRDALSRVLAAEIRSDREYPPFDRSIRDGYAVRSTDAGEGVNLRCVSEIKAGDTPTATVTAGTCVSIMTGAAVPPGADAVVMVEHTSRDGDLVRLTRAAKAGQHVVARGSEQAAGELVAAPGARLGFSEIAAAAQVGASHVSVFRRPRIAILSTGDEIVDLEETPGPFQIRNSNSESLAAQVALAGGEPVPLGNARDDIEDLRARIAEGLRADALILSGGVSMGKYDLVEPVLGEFAAEIVFDAVAIRPGKPVVFAICHGKPVFGLPGNPVSTMVTFELFVKPALEILSGGEPRLLPLLDAVLSTSLSERPGLTHFLPAVLQYAAAERDNLAGVTATPPRVTPIKWQGSGDVVAMSRANCLLVVPPDRERIEAGERVQILPRGMR